CAGARPSSAAKQPVPLPASRLKIARAAGRASASRCWSTSASIWACDLPLGPGVGAA
ncbi:MAG: hypothetical protein AVDCRST_MAG68-5443, partial [uncultured Gemmatimonadetes bacterium]